MGPSPSRIGEGTWLALAATVVIALCAAPYAVAVLAGRGDLERLGTFWFVRDFSQYQAAMREGGSGSSWLIHDRFTAEAHAPVLQYTLYVLLGKLNVLIGRPADDLLLFGALEWAGRGTLLAALYGFVAQFLDRPRERRLALLLAVGTLGLAGWAVPLRLLAGWTGADWLAERLPGAINVYLEINSFGVFLSAPHLMLGLALTLLAAPVYVRAQAEASPQHWTLVLGSVILALALVHPFNLPVLVSVLGVDALLRARLGPWWWRPLVPATVAALVATPVAVYNAATFALDPFWSSTYGVQNVMPAPPPWALPADFGLVLLAAPLAWPALRGRPPDRRRLLLLWVVLGLAWLYVPVPYQRRFAFGLQPALAVLGAVGLLGLNQSMRQHAWGPIRRRAVNYGLALAALMTSVLVYLSLLLSAATNRPAEVYLWSRAEADAGRWLGAHSDREDVVLAHTLFANPLVGVIDGRVVHGHIVATRESPRKEALVKRFYAAGVMVDERADLLRESGATVVALGPRERALGVDTAELEDGRLGLRPVYDADGVRWYRVQDPPR